MRGCKAKSKVKGIPTKDLGNLKGDILIQYLGTQGTDSINGMRVVNNDAVSHQSKNPEKCLDTAEREKKKKYLDACLKQSWHFNPFVASIHVLIRVEAEATLKPISSRLTMYWKKPYSRTCG